GAASRRKFSPQISLRSSGLQLTAPDRDEFGPPLPDSSDEGWECGEVLGNGLANTRGAKKAQRENDGARHCER
ncbi:MAG TPA: hypothetical protein VMF12_01650, partial [Xanthobacteraceae bacterium]|nr:hypothetical protein [Xanthobacteraceae bacterium]